MGYSGGVDCTKSEALLVCGNAPGGIGVGVGVGVRRFSRPPTAFARHDGLMKSLDIELSGALLLSSTMPGR